MFCSRFLPHEIEVVRGSLVDIACEGGGAHGSNIMQSGAWVGEISTQSHHPYVRPSLGGRVSTNTLRSCNHYII